MNPNILVFFFPLILPSLGILRPNTSTDSFSNSDRRQGQSNPGNQPFVSRPILSPPNNQQQPQQGQSSFPSPSRELLPPPLSPVAPGANSPSSPAPGIQFPSPPAPPFQPPEISAPQFQSQPSPSEQFELLPPLEIPPEVPIDSLPPQSSNSRPILFDSTAVDLLRPPLAPSNPDGSQPSQRRPQESSLLPTTGSGSGSPFSNPTGSFSNPPRPQGQRPNFREAPQQPTQDPGLSCLGSCDCPPDFNFVCGNNRFLYQNDCALECDKRCNPGLIKLDMAECS